MIRMLQNIDINSVAGIWLKANLNAHYFISKHYWVSNYELVKKMLAQAEVYVYEDDKIIQGFVGLNNEYLEGIFVADEINVYQKNTRAISFYQREGFIIQCEGWNASTDENEYTMSWQQK